MEERVKLEKAVREWVGEFNAIPQNIVIKLHMSGDDIFEITPLAMNEKGEEIEFDSFLPM